MRCNCRCDQKVHNTEFIHAYYISFMEPYQYEVDVYSFFLNFQLEDMSFRTTGWW